MQKITALLLSAFLLSIMVCYSQPSRVKKGFIKAGNFRIYYERMGQGDAIILLHAGLQDHTMWNAQVKTLSAQYDVITPDLPFHGKTTGTDTTLLAQEMIKILLDSLNLKTVYIAGLSMGASVVQDFIIAYPQRVKKAVLISAGINGYDKRYPVDSVSMQWYYEFEHALKNRDTSRAAKAFTRAWAEGVYRSGDSLEAPVSKYVYTTTLNNLRLHKMEGWPLLQDHPPAIDALGAITVPVLVVNGDKDLPYVASTSEYLEKNIRGARRVVMKDVAHMLNMEKPAEVNKLLLDFFSR